MSYIAPTIIYYFWLIRSKKKLSMAEEEKKLTLEDVNKMSFTEFIRAFGSVIEHTPLAASSVWGGRPFPDLPSLHRAFTTFISNLNESSKAGLLRYHPDLAGKLAKVDNCL